ASMTSGAVLRPSDRRFAGSPAKGGRPASPEASRSAQRGYVETDPLRQILDAVVEQLERVVRVVRVGTGILGDKLVIVGGFQQSRRPAGITIRHRGFPI